MNKEREMDLIQLLKDRIIPIVLNQDNNQQDPSLYQEKSTAVATFIPILLSIFKAKPELIHTLQNSLSPNLSDIFGHDQLTKNHFVEAFNQSSSPAETESLLSQTIAPTLGAVSDLAGSSDQNAILHYLDQNLDSIKSALPLWATSLLGGFGIGSLAHSTPHATTTPHIASHEAPSHVSAATPVAPPEKEKSGLLLPLIALIILGILVSLFLRYCNNKDETVANGDLTAVTNATTQPAFFQLNTNAAGELVTCQARIGNPSFVENIQKEVKQLFNHPIGCGIDSSQQYHAELIDQNALSSVIKLLKGSPNTTLTWTGSEIALQGSDANAIQALADKIKAITPNLTVKTQQGIDVSQAVNTSISDAEKALASLNPDQVKPIDIATALNLQIINFATGSNDIPDVNKSVLDQAAALMNRVPNVELTVKGFTDATGDANANKALSLKRAQSVADYLVSKGVDPSKLNAVGFGQENPIADNTTDEGKFKNRRIEFEVTNTETGVQREVTGESVKQTN